MNYTVYPKGMIVAIESTSAAIRTCEGRPDVNRICSRNTFSVYGNRILGDVNLPPTSGLRLTEPHRKAQVIQVIKKWRRTCASLALFFAVPLARLLCANT